MGWLFHSFSIGFWYPTVRQVWIRLNPCLQCLLGISVASLCPSPTSGLPDIVWCEDFVGGAVVPGLRPKAYCRPPASSFPSSSHLLCLTKWSKWSPPLLQPHPQASEGSDKSGWASGPQVAILWLLSVPGRPLWLNLNTWFSSGYTSRGTQVAEALACY